MFENLNSYYWKDKDCKLYLGDSLSILKTFPDNLVDMVFTDPPFMISQEIKICRQRNPKKYNTKRWKYQGKDIDLDFGIWDKFNSLEDYLIFTENWLKECARICREGAHLIIFFDKYKISYSIEIAQKYNLKPRQPLFWLKTNPTPQVRKVKFMTSLEMMLWFTKGTNSRKKATFNYELGQHSEVFIAPICQGHERYDFGRHPTQKPLKVLIPILEYFTNKNDIILDCFAGSGSLGIACLKLNRKCILIEQQEKYLKEIAIPRLEREKILI